MKEILSNVIENKDAEDSIGVTRMLNIRSSINSGCEMNLNRLVLVSNRLPITINTDKDGKVHVRPSSGGLVTALSPVLRDTSGVWVGWPGYTEAIHLDGHLDRAGKNLGCIFEPVILSKKELKEYYLGFSNQILWPLFHDFPEFCKLDSSFWLSYLKVNRRFSEKVAQISSTEDYIWVQDYHLMLLARELSSIGIKRQTGFFLHTPFPSPDIFEKLPWRIQIIKALLYYNLVGFQAQRDRDNFMQCLEKTIVGLHYTDTGRLIIINNENRQTAVGVFPISIDFSEFETLAKNGGVEERANHLRQDMPNCQIILGVDRLDYSKGIPLRLRAYRTFLERFNDLCGKVTMIQIVVPSRDDIPEYQAEKAEIESLVDEINKRFGNKSWAPIRYMYSNLDKPELVAYYRTADIALVTPVKDGMNLVAKEYCASKVDNNGVLILSEFAGAASQMCGQALTVNPYNINTVVNMIYRAYYMPDKERKARMQRLRDSVSMRDIHWWSNLFLRSAKQCVTDSSVNNVLPSHNGFLERNYRL